MIAAEAALPAPPVTCLPEYVTATSNVAGADDLRIDEAPPRSQLPRMRWRRRRIGGSKRNSICNVTGWDRTNDQPIMRPATDRLRECQGVSGVLNRLDRQVVFVSQSVRECHGAVVKTVVKTDALRFASAGANCGGKISQEFTWCVTECQEVSWRVRASQAVSRTTSRRRFDGLPTSKPGDTVQRMVQGLREVQEVAADAGERRASARPAAAWHGTRNTVPSRAFAAVSASAGCGYPSKIEGPR